MNPSISTKEGCRIEGRDGRQFLGEMIHTTHYHKESLVREERSMRKDLARRLNWNDYDTNVGKSEVSAEATFVSTKGISLRNRTN